MTARSVAGAVAWAKASARSVGASRFETSTTAWTRPGSATPAAAGASSRVDLRRSGAAIAFIAANRSGAARTTIQAPCANFVTSTMTKHERR